jgi:hypothetical protein
VSVFAKPCAENLTVKIFRTIPFTWLEFWSIGKKQSIDGKFFRYLPARANAALAAGFVNLDN